MLGEQAPVEGVDVVESRVDRVALAGRRRCRGVRKRDREARRRREPLERRRDRADVSGGNEQAGLAVANDVPDAADVGATPRRAGRQRLDQRHRRALVRGGERDDVRRAVDRRNVLLHAEEVRTVGDTELAGEPLELDAQRAIPGEREVGVDPAATQLGECGEQIVDPLDLGHPSEPADRRSAVIGYPSCARSAAACAG